MVTVYVGNQMHGAIKITKRKGKFYVYRLKELQVDAKSKPVKWIWESNSHENWSYKPYADNDVSQSPDGLLSYVTRWAHHKLHRV